MHTAFTGMKLPLTWAIAKSARVLLARKVWEAHGSTKTSQGQLGKVTTQAFALQEGHNRKRGNQVGFVWVGKEIFVRTLSGRRLQE